MEKPISQLISSIKVLPTGGRESSQLKPETEPPAEVKQQTPSVTPRGLNTPIDTIRKAWKSKLISDATDKEIAQRLSLIYFMVGLRPHHFPTKEEDYILFSYIRAKYNYRTLDELYLAFDLAINKELDLEEVKVYDQFSIEYLVRIMYAYSRYVFSLLKDEKKETPTPESIQVNNDEKVRDVIEFLEAEKDPTGILPLYLFDWMVQLNLLDYTEQEKIGLYKNAILTRRQDLEVALIRNPRDKDVKDDLDRLKINIREEFRNATNREIIDIHTTYKKIVLLDQRDKHKKKNDGAVNL